MSGSAVGSLEGVRVLVTRPEEGRKSLVAALEAEGAIPVLYPTIQTGPPLSWAPLEAAVQDLAANQYAWVVFTSATAVRTALGYLRAGLGITGLVAGFGATAQVRIAAVGRETARVLTEAGVPPDLVPTDERQEGLIESLSDLPPGTRVLFPQAAGGREHLTEELVRRGCVVDVVPVYETTPVNHAAPPPPFDAATFASPSALRAFVERWGTAPLLGVVVAVLGPTTHAAATALGVRVDVLPARSGIRELVEALVRHHNRGVS